MSLLPLLLGIRLLLFFSSSVHLFLSLELAQSVVLIITVSSSLHADYFGQTHMQAGRLFFLFSPRLLLIDLDWTKKQR